MGKHKENNWETKITFYEGDKSRDYITLTDEEKQIWSNNLNDRALKIAGYEKLTKVNKKL